MNVVTFFYLGTEVKKKLLDFFFTFSDRYFFKLAELADSCLEITSFFKFYLYHIVDMEMVLPSHEPQKYVVKGHFFGEKMLHILCIDEAFFPHELVLCV